MPKELLAAAPFALAVLAAGSAVRAEEGQADQQRGFYHYLGRAAQAGPSVPIIGMAPDNSGRETPYIGWTSGGMGDGSGSRTPPSGVSSARGENLTYDALARAAVRAIAANAIMR
jgi:hypothetical protein